jgi:hypothetical protein
MGPFVLITWEVMGVKHEKVEKKQGKGQTKGKKLQQYSFTDCINYNGHTCNVRATPHIVIVKSS